MIRLAMLLFLLCCACSHNETSPSQAIDTNTSVVTPASSMTIPSMNMSDEAQEEQSSSGDISFKGKSDQDHLSSTTNSVYTLVAPLLSTTWGQDELYKTQTPLKLGQATYPECTTIASA